MSLEIDCDGEHHGSGYNSGTINVGDAVYCEQCYEHLENRVQELEDELKEKNEEIEKLEQDIADSQSED